MFYIKLLIALTQGLALYFLQSSWLQKISLFLNPYSSRALSVVFLFIPIIVVQALGNMRLRTLLIWSVSAAITLWGLTNYSLWRSATETALQAISWEFIFYIVIALFITQSLITAGDKNRRFMAVYSTYFDVSWKLTVQLILSTLFLGIFWALLFLGAYLFATIDQKFFSKIVFSNGFSYPVSAIAFSLALHITNIKIELVRGTRTLILTLFSWLLPLLTAILIGFFVFLLFLDAHHLRSHAQLAQALLISGAVLVILINSVYQDGNCVVPQCFRITGNCAIIILSPLTVLGIFFLIFLVEHYGWTDHRIVGAAYLFLLAGYASAYLVALFYPDSWLKMIETANFILALTILVVILALLTPVADPARWSVANQVSRLHSGRVQANQLDFNYLRWHGQRFGRQALKNLQTHPQAKQVLLATYPFAGKTKANVIIAHTPDGKLPESFVNTDWSVQNRDSLWEIPSCLKFGDEKCDAWIVDLDHSGRRAIITYENRRFSGFVETSPNHWECIGYWQDIPLDCATAPNFAKAGKFKMVAPEPKIWPDLMIDGQRLQLNPHYHRPACTIRTS